MEQARRCRVQVSGTFVFQLKARTKKLKECLSTKSNMAVDRLEGCALLLSAPEAPAAGVEALLVPRFLRFALRSSAWMHAASINLMNGGQTGS